jgi:pyruvate dehydrogenase E1 component alpha subunit
MKEKKTLPNKTAPAAPEEGFSLISNQKLLALYGYLLKCRLLAEQARALTGLSGFFAASLGWEASAVAVAIDLAAEDTLATAHENLAPALVKGAPLNFFAELTAGVAQTDAGLTPGYGPLHLIVAANALNIATGVALANKVQSNGRVAAAFCGEGQQALDSWSEAFAIAGAHDLPILFICHNHEVEAGGQLSADEVAERAEALKIPVMPVDGSDVVAVYRVAFESIGRARRGRGPTLIDCRLSAAADPIAKMEIYLERKGLFSAEWKREVLSSFEKELDRAFAKTAPSRRQSEDAANTSYAIRERALIRKEWTLKF